MLYSFKLNNLSPTIKIKKKTKNSRRIYYEKTLFKLWKRVFRSAKHLLNQMRI